MTNFLYTCHNLTGNVTGTCPECGRRNRVRRRRTRRGHPRRRARIVVLAAVIAVLLVVNLFVVLRPRRGRDAHYQDGLAAFEAGRYSAAESAFRKHLDLVPDRAEARYMLGMSLLEQGEDAEAERELREAIRQCVAEG